MSKRTVFFIEAMDSHIDIAKHMGKLEKKSTIFANYTCAETAVDKLENVAIASVDQAAQLKEANAALIYIKLDSASFESGLQAIIELCDRHSFLLLSAKNGLVFAGTAANKANPIQDRACSAIDVVPTLCYMYGYSIPSDCTGSVLYQGLKNHNMPHDVARGLQDVIDHLEAAAERESRMPWDKHDCA